MGLKISEGRCTAASGSLSCIEASGIKDGVGGFTRTAAGEYTFYIENAGEDPATLSCKVYPTLPEGSTALISTYAPISIHVVDGGETFWGYKLQFSDDCDFEVYVEKH